MRNRRLAEVKDRVNMNSKCAQPTFLCNFKEPSRYRSAGRVDKNIEAAEFLYDLMHKTSAGQRVGNIAFQKSGYCANSFLIGLDILL